MTISLQGSSVSLFTRMGRLAKLLYDLNVYQGTTIPTDFQNIVSGYGFTDQDLIDSINSQEVGAQTAAGSVSSTVQNLSQQTLMKMVYQDIGLYRNDLRSALTELIRQMRASTDTVLGYTVSAATNTALVLNGNGKLVVDVHNSEGRNQDNAYAETIRVSVVGDASTSSTLAGNERFQAVGQIAASSTLAQDFPLGSGCNTSMSAIDATKDNSKGNLLTNSDFETFTVANTPDDWTIDVGVVATNVVSSTSPVYTGSKCVGLISGAGATLTTISQTFNSSSGTLGTLSPETAYSFNVYLRVNSVPAAGVIRVALVDGSNNVLTDVAGNSCSATVSANTLSSAAWTSFSSTFRTPYIMPSTVKLQIKHTTAVSNGTTVYYDHLGFGKATYAYSGGPCMAVFSGSSQYYAPDFYIVTISNNRPATAKSFQEYFGRTMSMMQFDLLLPTSGVPSINDSLIA